MAAINVYYGRDDLNKSKFIFDEIRKRQQEAILLVPEQFTLQAEEEAFSYLEERSLLSLQVMSFSGLGTDILRRCGGSNIAMVDMRGRQMLLTKVLEEQREELEMYRSYASDSDFVSMANRFISEMKQHDVDSETLKTMLDEGGEDTFKQRSFLRRKLTDIQKIYRAYEERIQGKYVDSEDKVNLIEERADSLYSNLGDTEIWIYGFDYFTGKNLRLIKLLAQKTKGVNIVMSLDDTQRDKEIFSVSIKMGRKLRELGEEISVSKINESYKRERSSALEHLERNIFAIPPQACDETRGITIAKGVNIYDEAGLAALKVTNLVREEGLRYRDILLICNDMDVRGDIYKRVFAQHGMDLFLDKKRSPLHNPLVRYIQSLLDVITGYRREDVLRLVKTGLTDLTVEEWERIENYSEKFKINGAGWKKPWEIGADEYSDNPEELEEIRKKLIEPIVAFAEDFKKDKTVEGRAACLYDFLEQKAMLKEKLEEMIRLQEETGQSASAQESAQMWNITVEMLEQMVEILPGEKISAPVFTELIKAGFEAEEVGVIPPTADGLMMGTMQRTRSAFPGVLMLLGVNEDVLPAGSRPEGVLTEDERDFLNEKGLEICKGEGLRSSEESLAIYRTIARTDKEVWISCSAADEKGDKILPSVIYDRVKTIFPNAPLFTAEIAAETPENGITGTGATLSELVAAVKEGRMGNEQNTWKSTEPATEESRRERAGEERREIDALREREQQVWRGVLRWYKRNRPHMVETVSRAMSYTGKVDRIPTEYVKKLYGSGREGTIWFSPSGLETFSICPFKFMMDKGIKPEKTEPYEVGFPDVGNIAHACMEEIIHKLNNGCDGPADENSLWDKVSDRELSESVDSIVDSRLSRYREGLMDPDRPGNGENVYKADRIKEICRTSVKMMVEHVRRGDILTVETEKGFGRRGAWKPVDLGDGAAMEGRIDRVDVLRGNKIKIIDYKTGKDDFSEKAAKMGIRLQLPLYLKAAVENSRDAEPAGAFYFPVKDPMAKGPDESTKKDFIMNGFMVGDSQVADAIDSEAGSGRMSDVAKFKKKKPDKKGNISFYANVGTVKEPEDFREFMSDIEKTAKAVSRDVMDGVANINPVDESVSGACEYCDYKGICKFESTFKDCNRRKEPR